MASYSFQTFVMTFEGPSGNFSVGSGSGNAEEGVTFAMTEDKNTMTIGADGSGMHSLHAGRSGTVTIRLLKTSPTNALLSAAYNFQTSNPAVHGQNILSGRDVYRGDAIVCQQCAFKKQPDITFAKDGGTNEWVFDSVYIDMQLGSGQAAGL